jgi:hypothetical protein
VAIGELPLKPRPFPIPSLLVEEGERDDEKGRSLQRKERISEKELPYGRFEKFASLTYFSRIHTAPVFLPKERFRPVKPATKRSKMRFTGKIKHGRKREPAW